MSSARSRFIDGGIQSQDGYQGEPIWKQPANDSTYYNFLLDSQCQIPIRNIEEVRKELQEAGIIESAQ